MKKALFLMGAGATLLASAFTMAHTPARAVAVAERMAPAAAEKLYQVVPSESSMTWVGRKVGGEHTGNLKLASGTVKVDRTFLRGGNFVIDMNSMTVTDLKDEGPNKRLLGHLRSDDFFSVEKHPTSTFTITNLAAIPKSKAGSANYNVTGSLTIKGITNQITFPVELNIKSDVLTAKGTLKFDRTKWDIKYRSSNFVENLGDKAIYDDIELSFNLVARADNAAKKAAKL